MRPRQMLYILPNLFTLSSVFCGLLAIHWATSGEGALGFYRAALAILFAAVFDGMDGRVARLTRTQSEFGAQLDSLGDVISFGVAPAILVYRWGLGEIYVGGLDLGFLVCFAFTAAGALRLARFNVLAQRSRCGSSKFFIGLPIPAAACTIAALVFAHHQTNAAVFQKQITLLVLVPLLSWLMVSNVRYPTFKQVHFSRRLLLGLVAGVGLATLVTLRTKPAVTLLLLLATYIALGLVAGALRVPRRVAVWRSTRRGQALVDDGVTDDHLEEEPPSPPHA